MPCACRVVACGPKTLGRGCACICGCLVQVKSCLELPQLSKYDDSVRRFIALIDECYDRKVPVCIEAQVPIDQLYTQGYLEFAFRRTLSRLQEMQLQRFGL